MNYITGFNRNQAILIPETIDKLIEQDNAVRFVDVFVNSIDVVEFGFRDIRLNKEFRRTFKIRNSMPNFESALTLLSKVAMDKEDGYMKYPIYKFKFDTKLNEIVRF